MWPPSVACNRPAVDPLSLSSLEIDQVLRYMGCPPGQAEPSLRKTVEECAGELLAAIRPRWVSRVFSLSFEADGVRLDNGLLLPGQDLKHHLAGCTQAALFALTLSAQADACIRRAESRDMLRALALDCCASQAVEQLCDQAEAILQSQFPGCFFPYRFSPGYGDLPLTLQGDLLQLLDAPRKIGLCATASHLLTPRKSVTALMGVSQAPVAPAARSCVNCPGAHSCQYRKSGGHCGISNSSQ